MMVELPDELAALPTFPSVDALYVDDERRRRSPEWDFGVHWRLSPEVSWPRWRVSWIVEPGDVYATEAFGTMRVLLLGKVAPLGEYPHSGGLEAWHRFHRSQPIERLLDGWARLDPPVLAWILDRLRLGVPA